jgi:type I restriction enzyme R subunit
MIEFKQIIGRGTRLYEGKDFFTIIDFYDNVKHFSDPEWDGEPEAEINIKKTETIPSDNEYPEGVEDSGPDKPYDNNISEEEQLPEKLTIRLSDGKERTIKHMVETLYFGSDGKAISAKQFLQNLFGTLPEFFKNEGQLRTLWSNPATRKRLLDELAKRGFDNDKLKSMQELIDAKDSDMFDVLRYVAFARDALTRKYRADHIDHDYFAELSEDEEAFVNFVLGKYKRTGVEELSEENLSNLLKIKYGTSTDAVAKLRSVENIRSNFLELQKELYEVVAK